MPMLQQGTKDSKRAEEFHKATTNSSKIFPEARHLCKVLASKGVFLR